MTENICLSSTLPSNIAFIKYWGKYGQQFPSNPSLSMTLKKSLTKTSITFSHSEKLKLTYFFEGKENKQFSGRLLKYIKNIIPYFPFLENTELVIVSDNTFPHSAGIASSASSYATFALIISHYAKIIKNKDLLNDIITSFNHKDLKNVSNMARLGSGSASRSLFNKMALWGESDLVIEESNDEYAVPYHHFHDSFNHMQDSILIVDSSKKAVSSSIGHHLMGQHPYSKLRFNQARKRIKLIDHALEFGDWNTFGNIIEEEALELHSLMMSSTPSYILMRPNTLKIIELVKSFRRKSKLSLYFTLDAGPNLHLVYPPTIKNKIIDFIENDCVPYLENGQVIYDEMGDDIPQVEIIQ